MALRSFSRRHAPRASSSAFHPPMRCSTGWSARPSRIVAAIMIPAEASAPMTSQAPVPSIASCSPWRAMRAAPQASPKPLRAAPALRAGRRGAPARRASAACVIPMPTMTSALRASVSTWRLAARDFCSTSLAAWRVSRSVSTAIAGDDARAERGNGAEQRMHEGDDSR